MYRVKNLGFGQEDCRRSSSVGDVLPTRASRSSHDPQQHATDEERLAMWLEKIRRRKAYRSPFSALMPAHGCLTESELITIETKEDDDDDGEYAYDDETTYLDASSATPSWLSFRGKDLSTSSQRDPFKSPQSVVRGKDRHRRGGGGGRGFGGSVSGGRILRHGGITFDLTASMD